MCVLTKGSDKAQIINVIGKQAKDSKLSPRQVCKSISANMQDDIEGIDGPVRTNAKLIDDLRAIAKQMRNELFGAE